MNAKTIEPGIAPKCAEQDETSSWRIAALYKFVELPNPVEFRAPLERLCKRHGVFGTLLLAREGINGTIAGPDGGLGAVLDWLNAQPPFHDLDIKESWAPAQPFHRMKVRMKKEIVTLGVDGIDPNSQAGNYVDPVDWNALISREDVIVIDTRNDYEVAIGTFQGAINPGTESFRDLPEWVEKKLDAAPDTPIAMFCTGGIRCEKSTAYLRTKGYGEVYHLRGGILKYLETVPPEESLWDGECFVFDQRVSVRHGLEPGTYGMCHACRMPLAADDMESDTYQVGLSCPHCHETTGPGQKARFTERQRQIDLAKSRNEPHIAADIAKAKAAKRKRRESEDTS